MIDLQAILFCGGRGSRLYPITDFYQKVMMPIGREGRPLLEYVIQYLKSFGITDFIALVGYRHNLIRRYFGNGDKLGINLRYVVDSPKYKGTAGALYNARKEINKNNILIYYTDILTNLDMKHFYEIYKKNDKMGLIWVDNSWEIQEGVIEINDQDMITSISRKPKEKMHANTSISILNAKITDDIEELVVNLDRTNIDLSSDIFPKLVRNKELFAYSSDEWWIDLGSLKRYRSLRDTDLEEKFGGIW